MQSPSPSDLKGGCFLSPIKHSKNSASLEASTYDPVEFDEKTSGVATRGAQFPYIPCFISAFRTPKSSRQMAIREMDRSV